MKTRPALLRSLGALALLVFTAFPCSTACALPQCGDVNIEYYYGGDKVMYFELEVEPSDCLIYYTTSIDNPFFDPPSRSGINPIYPPTLTCESECEIQIPFTHTLYIKAFAWKPFWSQSLNLSEANQHNPTD